MSKVGRVAEQFVVRLPEGMRDRIAEEAEKNGRSMNSEIVSRLEASFGSSSVDMVASALLEARLSDLDKRMGAVLKYLEDKFPDPK